MKNKMGGDLQIERDSDLILNSTTMLLNQVKGNLDRNLLD